MGCELCRLEEIAEGYANYPTDGLSEGELGLLDGLIQDSCNDLSNALENGLRHTCGRLEED